MIVLSNSNAQVIPAGQSATFNTVLLDTGCAECYRQNTGVIDLTRRNAIYEVSFTGNIGATEAGDAQIAIALNGSPMLETTGIVPTAAAGDIQNCCVGTTIKTCCCGVPGSLTVVNSGTGDLNIGVNPKFSVKRVA